MDEAWMSAARCRDRTVVPFSALSSPDLFYPDPGSAKSNAVIEAQTAKPAQRICAFCPVRLECLNYALEYEEGRWKTENSMLKWQRRLPFGIWGGHTAIDRHRKAIEHNDDCATKKCRPPCRPIPERVALLEELFQAKIPSLTTKRERKELAS